MSHKHHHSYVTEFKVIEGIVAGVTGENYMNRHIYKRIVEKRLDVHSWIDIWRLAVGQGVGDRVIEEE